MKIKYRFIRWLVCRVVDKIDSLSGDLSVYGFPTEAYRIREMLYRIRDKVWRDNSWVK